MSGELPVGWAFTTIQEVVHRLEYGFTAKAENRCDGPRFLRITDINHGLVDWTSVPRCKIDENGLAKYRLKHGDIVFARTGSIDKACMVWNPPEAVFASYLIRGRPIEARTARWLDAFVASSQYRAQAAAASAGIGRANINAKSIGRIALRLPPLLEQHRIIEAIESYFTRLDDAVATLERVQRNLKRYRVSVLKAAVEGRLVPTEAELARAEGRDYEAASVLLGRILAERRRRWEEAELAKMKAKGKTPKDDKWKAKYKEPTAPDTSDFPDLPEGWTWIRLGDVAELLNGDRGKNYPSRAAYVEEGIPFITATNLADGRLDRSSLNYISEQRYDLLRAGKIEQGDILYCLRGSLGKSAIVHGIERGAIASSLVIVRLPPSLGPDYIHAALTSPWGQHLIELHDNGTAQPNLSAKSLADFAVPFPPVAEAHRITKELGRQMSIIAQLEASTLFNETRCAQLRQSVLKWAFEGRIVDQDPTDEPASRFLERIQAERESTNGNPRRRPRRPKARSSKA